MVLPAEFRTYALTYSDAVLCCVHSCADWTMIGNDTAASIFVDNRDSVDGLRSIRIHTPVTGKGMMIVGYPTELATWHATPGLKPGQKWTLSVWARAPAVATGAPAPILRFGAPYYNFYSWQDNATMAAKEAKCVAPNCYHSKVTLTAKWQKYSLAVTSPDPLWHSSGTSWAFLEVVTAGVALCDLLELVPA